MEEQSQQRLHNNNSGKDIKDIFNTKTLWCFYCQTLWKRSLFRQIMTNNGRNMLKFVTRDIVVNKHNFYIQIIQQSFLISLPTNHEA
jgi:hypothetical protein